MVYRLLFPNTSPFCYHHSQEADETASVADDASFVTAQSHDQATVHRGNTLEAALPRLDAASVESLSDMFCKAAVMDQDEVESVLTVEQNKNSLVPQPPTVEESWIHGMAQEIARAKAAAKKPFIPRAVQVDKVLLHLQLHVSDLIRPRMKKASNLLRSLLPAKRSVNPYFEIELLHAQSDVAISLHKSEPYFQRREALWEPVRFAIDATLAQAKGFVLAINLYHKNIKNGKCQEDEWIGGHQAPPLDLNESVDQIPLKRDQMVTGKVRLVSYQMTPLNRADCWRVFL